jgi:acetyl-CoA C-acetyltransferase
MAHEVFQAWLTFAVFDNARRARLGTGLDEYRVQIGELFAPMSHVAAASPHAWFRTARDAAEIVTPAPDNRMVGYPYTKYAIAVMDVDMAAALVVATHERADALGIPPDRRVYLRGWCYATDPVLVAAHPDMSRSPAMSAAGSAALRAAGAGIDDIAYFDLYSCFASSLHFACDALGLAPGDGRGLTVTGGLPYHGGPASGYLTHSIAAMVERLRAHPDAAGLVSGVGMHMTKHVFGCYAAAPGMVQPAQPPGAVPPAGEAPVVAHHEGDARVAAYSVVHGRDGAPEWALLVCDVAGGARVYAQMRDPEACAEAERSELVGTTVRLRPRVVEGPAGTVTVNLAQPR